MAETVAKEEKTTAPVEKPAAVEGAAPAEGAAAAAGPRRVKKGKKNVAHADVHVLSTFNNTVVTFSDSMGNAISWCSAGAKGFRGSRKNTPFAAQVAAEDAARKALDNGVRTAQVYVSGPGAGRESALRAIASVGIRVTYIEDVTPVPHNGCRPPKRRRV